MKATVFLALLAFLAVIERGSALKCYYCVSGQDGCDDEFNENGSGVQEVDDMDYCQKTKSEASGVQSVARTGGVGSMPKDGCETVSGGGVTTSTCYCDSEFCNSSSMASASFTLMAFGLVAKYMANFV